MKRFRNAQGGFTLMELMVVIVIVAILAAVAVPLYINYVNDARNTEAKGAIGAIITAEQTWYQSNNDYTAVTFDDATGKPTDPASGFSCDLSEPARNWTFTVTLVKAGEFKAVATGRADCAGREVTVDYSRTVAPVWTEK